MNTIIIGMIRIRILCAFHLDISNTFNMTQSGEKNMLSLPMKYP